MQKNTLGPWLTVATCLGVLAIIAAALVHRSARPEPSEPTADFSVPKAPIPTPGPPPKELQSAPEGTWGMLVINAGNLLSAPVMERVQGARTKNLRSKPPALLGEYEASFRRIVAFAGGEATDPTISALSTLAADAADEIESRVAADSAEVSVAGYAAHRGTHFPASVLDISGVPVGEVPVGERASEALVAFRNEGVVVSAPSREVLAALLERGKSEDEVVRTYTELSSLLGLYTAEPLNLAVTLPRPLAEVAPHYAPGTELPPILEPLRGMAIGVSADEQFHGRVTLRTETKEDAQTFVRGFGATVQAMRQELENRLELSPGMASMLKSITELLQNLRMSSENRDVHLRIALDGEEAVLLPITLRRIYSGRLPGGPLPGLDSQ